MRSTAVVIVSHNTREILGGCLASVAREAPAELVVADNGSTDGTLEMVARDFPGAMLDVDPRNPGYGAGANRGIRRTRSDFVLVLNSDTVLAPGALAALEDYFAAHPRAGLIGPRLVNADGTLQRSCHAFPSPLVTLLEYSWLGDVVARVPGLRQRYAFGFAHDRAVRVDWVTGAALALRRTALDAVGGFDERYFMYFEEVDLARRLHAAGWETHFAPVTDVVHLGGASTAADRVRMSARQFASLGRYYHDHARGRVARARAAVRAAMLMKLSLYGPAYLVARRGARRAVLGENLRVWWNVLRRPLDDARQEGT